MEREKETQEKGQSVKDGLKEWIKVIIVAVLLALFIQNFILSSTRIIGNSMLPTLHEADRLFVNRVFFMAKDPKRGDLIEFHAPDDPTKDYIKRVIGISGDRVQIKDGKVYVNDVELEENYINGEETLISGENEWIVGDDEVFVLGDNRLPGESKDSRVLGSIKKDSIVGVAFFRYLPFNRIGILN